MKCLYKVPFSGFFIVSAESAEDAKSMSKDDPESLRPTAHWIKEDSFYKDSTVWRCAACKGKFVLHGETPENENYQYCPACSAIIIKDGQGR